MSQRAARTARLAALCFLAAVFLAVEASPVAAYGTRPAVYGCQQPRPDRLGVQPAAFATLVRICSSPLSLNVSVDNLSNVVLTVALEQAESARLGVPLALDLGAEAARHAAAGVCTRPPVTCRVPAGSIVYAESFQPISVRFEVDVSTTFKANIARALGSWIEAQFTSPSRRLAGSIVACASDAASLAMREQRTWEDALRRALRTQTSCSSLLTNLHGRAVTPSRKTTIAKRVVRTGKIMAGGNWVDEIVYGVARIIRR